MGKKSARFLRYAGFKLAEELTEMMPRGCFGGAEETLVDEIVADSSLEQSVTAYKRLPPQPCPEGAESEVSIEIVEKLAYTCLRCLQSFVRIVADLPCAVCRLGASNGGRFYPYCSIGDRTRG